MAVLPLVRWRWLDPTCLVIGAMAPDFEYFARMKQASNISHTWLGLVAWNLPVTIVLALAFHAMVKWPLVLVAPRFVAGRAAAFARRPWAEPWTVGFAGRCAVSALIGATTHLLWDGVTHSDGMIASRVAALREVVTVPVLGDMALSRVLQHASTVIGLIAVSIVVARALWKIEPVALPDPRRTWPRLIAMACVGGGIGLSALRIWRWYDIGGAVVILISGGLFGTLLASFVLRDSAATLRSPDVGRAPHGAS